uniref:F-ATPase gamma subunit n=1 Tax=Tetraselmis sp. GSL018 TaxID=582737 RepID=A0A061RBP2_9CHLO|mmetsp:Transcript_20356/g.48492  ORF Transcript_20356/g.48492 Transcript_20356/m.48492 type:complete len:365 (-) Transcript_20356:93-1187(-)
MNTVIAKNSVVLGRSSFAGERGSLAGRRFTPAESRGTLQIRAAGLKEIKSRNDSVKNTKKITDAMKLVAAAKVRRAQDAVVNGRPFSEALVKVLFGVNQKLAAEDVDSPLCTIRPVKKVMLMCVTGDRGLCGGYNSFVIKKTEQRAMELQSQGLEVSIITIGRKGESYFKRRPQYNMAKTFNLGQNPNSKQAQGIADEIYADFVSGEVDKVEMIFTKFVSLISSKPIVQTLVPLSPQGELCDVDGNCVDAAEDEVFQLTTSEGKLSVERSSTPVETGDLDASLIFEQEPAQILDALLPLYLNSQLLRSLQESLASELAARMNAMSNASDNAKELSKNLSRIYNRGRQAKITTELSEICAGAAST